MFQSSLKMMGSLTRHAERSVRHVNTGGPAMYTYQAKTEKEFQDMVMKNSDKPRLVNFSRNECEPCQKHQPRLEAAIA